MLGLGKERLGAVILGIERRCGINVPDMMKRTLNDIFGGVTIKVTGTCKKENKRRLEESSGDKCKTD